MITVVSTSGERRTVRGALFDMDGTIVDSGAATERTWAVWAQLHGVEDLRIQHGSPAVMTVRSAFPDADEETIEALTQFQLENERTDLDGIVAMNGAHALIAWLEDHGLPWAVVTSADRLLALARLGAAGIHPDVLVTWEDITHGKPHPEPYLLGARLIGVPIEECLIVEDAPAGVQSGLASGGVTAALNGHDAHLMIIDLPHLHDLLAEGLRTIEGTD